MPTLIQISEKKHRECTVLIMNLFKRLAIDSALKKRKAQILAENDPNNG